MLFYTWFFMYITFARSAAQELPAIWRTLHKNEPNVSYKDDGSIKKLLTLKTRNKVNKLTFQTLYPQFMLNWKTTKLSEKITYIPHGTLRHGKGIINQESKQYMNTNDMTKNKNHTSKYNTFIQVVTMRPYLSRKIRLHTKKSRNNSNESGDQIMQSNNQMTQNVQRPVKMDQRRTTDYVENLVKQSKISGTTFTNFTSQSKSLNRLKSVESDIRKFGTLAKNGKHHQDFQYRRHYLTNHTKTVKRETQNKFSDFSLTHSQKVTKKITSDDKEVDSHDDIHYLTKDPLQYDSFDLRLEDDSTMREFLEVNKLNPPKASKAAALGNTNNFPLNQKIFTPATNIHSNRRNGGLSNVPHPPGFHKTIESRESDVFDDILKRVQVQTASNQKKTIHKKTYGLDDTEALGEKMLERLNLPGLNYTRYDKISDNDLYNFDHLKYVNNMMAETSLPLYEKRNVILKSVNKRLDDLYKSYNLRPRKYKDNLDDLLKSIGSTLH